MTCPWLFQFIKPSELLACALASSATLIAISKLSIVVLERTTRERRYFVDEGIIATAYLFLRGGFFIWAFFFGIGGLLMVLHIASNCAPLIIYGLDFTCFPQVATMSILGIGWFLIIIVGLAAFVQGRQPELVIEEMMPW